MTVCGLAIFLLAAAGPATTADRIVVNKARREMLLYRGAKAIRTYRVALGRTPEGAKLREGDGKTPEGDYIVSGRNPKSKFHLSLRISYPSRADRERAEKAGVTPGGDIMIHGLPKGQEGLGSSHRENDWTEGCIAVTNEEIEEIWRIVKDGTPIRINP